MEWVIQRQVGRVQARQPVGPVGQAVGRMVVGLAAAMGLPEVRLMVACINPIDWAVAVALVMVTQPEEQAAVPCTW